MIGSCRQLTTIRDKRSKFILYKDLGRTINVRNEKKDLPSPLMGKDEDGGEQKLLKGRCSLRLAETEREENGQ
jgi:hypothetical protein